MKPASTTLRRYMTGLAESVFQSQLGVVDVSLVDYVSDLLLRFVRTDAMHRVRNLSGHPMSEVADMLVEANSRIGTAPRAKGRGNRISKGTCHIYVTVGN